MSLPLDIRSDHKESSMGTLEKQLICPICMDVFTKPVVILPCLHNLCRKCANELYQPSLFQVGIGGRFRCPTCRSDVVLDRHGVYGLQRNLLVENIIDVYKQESESSRPPPPKPPAEFNCAEHEDEKLNIYCLTCQVATCSLCKVFGAHKNCQVVPLPDVYQQQKAELSDRVACLVSTNDRVQTFVDELEALCRNIEENSRIQIQILCEKFDHMSTILEERRKIMIQQITSEQEQKTGWTQYLLQTYNEHVDTNSKLIQAAQNAIEEPEMASFVQTSKDLIEKVGKASNCFTLETLDPDYENMDHYKVDFDAEERVLYQLDFMEIEEEVEETPEELESEPESEPEPVLTPEPDPKPDQDLKSEASEMMNPTPETTEDTWGQVDACGDIRKVAVCEKNSLSTSQVVTLVLYFLAFLVILQRIWGSIQYLICI
ncbi:tripartite motif containing 101 isoform X2 [Ctenopharyngodon idella]|uniref:tripartite motif containing 101 isoform X2 n=1 Tax=Ctenopharyngodon idella TaxID=7959 RepID=UPI00222EB582|nr:tripartite motif containing 101 isoform X2 [Ctenopharyngodon idella]